MKAGTRAQDLPARNQLIVADRALGLSFRAIGEKYGLSERQARTIWTENRTRFAESPDEDATATLDHALARFEEAISTLAELISSTENDAVRLGAIRLQMDFEERRLALLQSVGLVPSYSIWRAVFDFRVMEAAAQELFTRMEGDQDVLDEFFAKLRSSVRYRSKPSVDASLPGREGQSLAVPLS